MYIWKMLKYILVYVILSEISTEIPSNILMSANDHLLNIYNALFIWFCKALQMKSLSQGLIPAYTAQTPTGSV